MEHKKTRVAAFTYVMDLVTDTSGKTISYTLLTMENEDGVKETVKFSESSNFKTIKSMFLFVRMNKIDLLVTWNAAFELTITEEALADESQRTKKSESQLLFDYDDAVCIKVDNGYRGLYTVAPHKRKHLGVFGETKVIDLLGQRYDFEVMQQLPHAKTYRFSAIYPYENTLFEGPESLEQHRHLQATKPVEYELHEKMCTEVYLDVYAKQSQVVGRGLLTPVFF